MLLSRETSRAKDGRLRREASRWCVPAGIENGPGLNLGEGASGRCGAFKKRTAGHRQVPRRMEHRHSSGCRGCSNGHNLADAAYSY
jgi:hypothetical protein